MVDKTCSRSSNLLSTIALQIITQCIKLNEYLLLRIGVEFHLVLLKSIWENVKNCKSYRVRINFADKFWDKQCRCSAS